MRRVIVHAVTGDTFVLLVIGGRLGDGELCSFQICREYLPWGFVSVPLIGSAGGGYVFL